MAQIARLRWNAGWLTFRAQDADSAGSWGWCTLGALVAMFIPPQAEADRARWKAVTARDRTADGSFVYAVSSTGIYCRPSCVSRRPRRDRVAFFDSPIDAERSGFRACKRCRPRVAVCADPWVEKIRRVCALLVQSEVPLPLKALTHRVGGSPFHLQRNFKRLTGLTPRQFSEACRFSHVKRRLRRGEAITAAMYGAGYGSSSRFYERAAPKLGMSPSTYRRGGAGMHIQYTITDSAMGRLLVAATDRGVCAVAMGGTDEDLQRSLTEEYPAANVSPGGDRFAAWTREILARVDGQRPRVELPLDLQATAFQWQVWQALDAIPFGETRTYSEIAAAIGIPRAVRAVGRACATNPVAIAIPCHRAVGANGTLTGYRWGVARKKALLDRERALVPSRSGTKASLTIKA